MPNIQMMGMTEEQYAATKELIDKAMLDLRLDHDAVTTWIENSHVFTCDGNFQTSPFLRVCSTNPEDIPRIIKAFKRAGLNMDCETLILNGFHPAAEMK